MNSNDKFTFPGNSFATYSYHERQLTINDFVAIDVGTKYNDIISEIGEPNGLVGSGMSWPYYQLADNSYIVLMFNHDSSGEYFEVINIQIIDSSGRIFELVK